MATKHIHVAISGFGGTTDAIEAMATGPKTVARILAEQRIIAQYGYPHQSIETDTLFKNMRIVPISTLRRTARGRAMLDAYLDHVAEFEHDDIPNEVISYVHEQRLAH